MLEDKDPYRNPEVQTVGTFSSKALAIKNARAAFQDNSHGCFVNGAFTDPNAFEDTQDNSGTIGESGVVFMQRDQEGQEVSVSLQTVTLDKEYVPRSASWGQFGGVAM